MRILQVGKYYHPAKGGIESHVRHLALGLQPHAKVEIVVAGQPRSSFDLVDGLTIERLATPATVLSAPICPSLVDRLRACESDIVHIHLPNPWAAMAYLISGCKRPMVASYHSDIVRQSLSEPLFRPVLLKFLDRASAILCASPNIIEHSPILSRFRSRCIVVPYGIPHHVPENADIVKARSTLTKRHKPVILAVGRLVYYKGFEHLISAMAHVDASLFIIGTGPLKANLTSLASNLRVSEKVTFLEHVENVHPYHHAADLFVLPSVARSEAFGIVQLEAMAAGKPVINTKLESGVPFVSQHGLTGLTVPPRDSWALAEAMNCLLNNEDLRRQYGASARRRAMGEFSLEMMIGRTMTVYRTILASPQTPTGACFQENSFAAAN